MSDKPIIFSGPMVRALLEGRKTQTRRVLRNITPYEPERGQPWRQGGKWSGVLFKNDDSVRALATTPYAPGDRLWVRETWAPNEVVGSAVIYRAETGGACGVQVYDLKSGACEVAVSRWRSPIHMPRSASRLTLTVTEARVQRLQEITSEDARAEGWSLLDSAVLGQDDGDVSANGPRTWFRKLWNSLHGKEAWEANPWVVAVSFTVERANLDARAEP